MSEEYICDYLGICESRSLLEKLGKSFEDKVNAGENVQYNKYYTTLIKQVHTDKAGNALVRRRIMRSNSNITAY